MTTKHLWLVIDRRTGPESVRPRYAVCSSDYHAPEVVGIPLTSAESIYIQEWTGHRFPPIDVYTPDGRILLAEFTPDPIWQEQEREQRRKRGVE